MDVPDDPIRVLLVEDSPALADLIQEVLAERRGSGLTNLAFQVVHAGRLTSALAHLESGDIDVVLLDLTLPDSQGLDTLIKTHAHAPGVPVVVLSALDDEELAAAAVRHGAQDYLVKGEMPLELVARSLRYAIERRRAEANLLREQAARTVAEEALRHARRADKQRRQRQRREIRSLEQLSAPSTVTVTARVFGIEPLSSTLPGTFQDLVQRYAQLLDLGVEQRAYKVDHRLPDALRAMAEEIGFLNAGPRDVVELHTAALKQRIAAVPPLKAQAYIDEARVMVLELMGYLVAYYRS
jgi:DNA-binding response OmpR family regulator